MQANRRDLCGQRFGKLTVSAGSKELKVTGREQIPGCAGAIVVMNLLFLAQILSEDIPKAVAASN